jgi:hypothetical protein
MYPTYVYESLSRSIVGTAPHHPGRLDFDFYVQHPSCFQDLAEHPSWVNRGVHADMIEYKWLAGAVDR